MNDAVRGFVEDLFDAGISRRRRAVLALLYDRTLTARSDASWKRLYRAIFSALHLLSQESRTPTWRSSVARASLFRIVEDDLGAEIFGAGALSRLRAQLGSERERWWEADSA
jgi:hypothetical protein